MTSYYPPYYNPLPRLRRRSAWRDWRLWAAVATVVAIGVLLITAIIHMSAPSSDPSYDLGHHDIGPVAANADGPLQFAGAKFACDWTVNLWWVDHTGPPAWYDRSSAVRGCLDYLHEAGD